MQIGSKKKLYFFFLLLFTVAGAIIFYALLATRDFNREVRKVSRQVYPETKIAIEIKGLVTNVIEKFNVSRAAGTEGELANIEKIDKEIGALLEQLLKLDSDNPEGGRQIEAVREAYKVSYQAGSQMVAASVAQSYADEAAWTEKFDTGNKNLLQALHNIVEASTMSHNSAMDHILRVSNRLNIILLVSFAVMTGLGAMIFYMISQISRQLAGMGVESTQATGGLLEAVENINAMSVQLASETSSSSAAVEEIVASMDQLSQQARDNQEAARTADSEANNLHDTAIRSKKSMEDVVAAMQAMAEADKEISSLVKSIENIAFQTNLLALNAAVEAARAGEAGAGFAVVAGEVRNLASRTTETSSQVASIIQRLDEKVTAGVTMVDNLQNSFVEMNSGSDSVVRQMAKIIETGRRQAETETKIREALTAIDDMVQSQAAMSEEGSATVQDVKEQVKTLHQMMEKLMLFWEGAAKRPSLPAEQ